MNLSELRTNDLKSGFCSLCNALNSYEIKAIVVQDASLNGSVMVDAAATSMATTLISSHTFYAKMICNTMNYISSRYDFSVCVCVASLHELSSRALVNLESFADSLSCHENTIVSLSHICECMIAATTDLCYRSCIDCFVTETALEAVLISLTSS